MARRDIVLATILALLTIRCATMEPTQNSTASSTTLSWADRPLVVAHRGGKMDWPENTLYAFQQDLAAGVGMIELDVQVTSDGHVVLFHPRDLSDGTTDGKGSIDSKTLAEVQALHVKAAADVPPQAIPTLQQALAIIPKDKKVVVDMKSLPVDTLVQALVREIPAADWSRLVFYSTNSEHLTALRKIRPDAIVFESRDVTRDRLVTYALNETCTDPSQAAWLGFELKRPVTLAEKFALGEGVTPIEFRAWTPESAACTKKEAPDAKLVFFGINSVPDYCESWRLGAYAVYSDSPRETLLITEEQCR